jgi:hypothetical protein
MSRCVQMQLVMPAAIAGIVRYPPVRFGEGDVVIDAF